jgi:hypothetical protein
LEVLAGDWRKLHNEELHDLFSSQNIIRIIKSRWMRWARHVARMREFLDFENYLKDSAPWT